MTAYLPVFLDRLLRWIVPVLVLVWSGCDTAPMEPVDNRPAALYGTVLDTIGQPMENVSIHYVPKLIPAEQAPCFQSADFVLIGYTVSDVGAVKVTVRDYDSPLILQTLVNQAQHPIGEYVALMQTQTLTNGPYLIRVEANGTSNDFPYLILRPFTGLSSTVPLARTNAFGKFQVSFERMGIGETFTKPGPSGASDCAAFVSSGIEVVLIASGFPITLAPVDLGNTFDPVDATFTISESE